MVGGETRRGRNEVEKGNRNTVATESKQVTTGSRRGCDMVSTKSRRIHEKNEEKQPVARHEETVASDAGEGHGERGDHGEGQIWQI